MQSAFQHSLLLYFFFIVNTLDTVNPHHIDVYKRQYLDDLIYNSRLEVRVGFHKNVIEELLLLRSVAQEELRTAEVIQMDEKKLAMKELKEARLAAKREEKLKQMDELPALKELENSVPEDTSTPLERFEFNLVEYK